MQAQVVTNSLNRKPAQLEMIGGKSARQRMWELMRSSRLQGKFSGVHIIDHANVSSETYCTYIQCLEAGGFIEAMDKKKRVLRTYRILKDCGIEAPKLTRDGKPSKTGLGIEAVWRTLRMMKNVDLDVSSISSHISAAGVDLMVSSIRVYLQALKRAGYLTVVMPATYNRMERIRLKPDMDTGPRPPQIQKVKTVYDPNLNKVMHAEDPQEAL